MSGYRGFEGRSPPVQSLERFFARYAELVADNPAQQKLIRDRRAEIRFLEYD